MKTISQIIYSPCPNPEGIKIICSQQVLNTQDWSEPEEVQMIMFSHFYPRNTLHSELWWRFSRVIPQDPQQKQYIDCDQWLKLDNVWARDPCNFFFNTATVWGHTHNDAHWLVCTKVTWNINDFVPLLNQNYGYMFKTLWPYAYYKNGRHEMPTTSQTVLPVENVVCTIRYYTTVKFT